MVGHVFELFPVLDGNAAARLFSYRKASTSSEVARILLRGLYSRLARGTWVAAHRFALAVAAQAVLTRTVGDGADVALLHDQRLMAHQPEDGSVGVVKSASIA